MVNVDLFKMFLDPKLIEKLAKDLKKNPKMRQMYNEALKENPELENDVEGLIKHIFPGGPPNA